MPSPPSPGVRFTRAVAGVLTTGLLQYALAAPPLVPVSDANRYVGEIVTIEGDVTAARTTSDGCILLFSDDQQTFRAVLLLPLLSNLPREPDRLYTGKRVRVSGRIQRFQGRPEMVLRTPDQVSIVDVAGTEGPPPPADAPPAPLPLPQRPSARISPTPTPGAPPPAAERATPPPPTAAPLPSAVPPEAAEAAVPALQRPDPCPTARTRWQDAAAAVTARMATLQRCLDAATHHCRSDAAPIAAALANLEWAEQEVEARCP